MYRTEGFSNSIFYSSSRLRTCDLNHAFCFLHRIQLGYPSSQSILDESGWSGKSKLVLKQCSSVFLFLKIFKIEYQNNKNKIISNVKFAHYLHLLWFLQCATNNIENTYYYFYFIYFFCKFDVSDLILVYILRWSDHCTNTHFSVSFSVMWCGDITELGFFFCWN